MDIFAHALWTGAAATTARRSLHIPIRPAWAALAGVFPDLFAFSVPFVLLLWRRLTLGPPATGEPHSMPHLSLAWQLYQISHSLIVFAAVFGLAWLLVRRPVFELLGWALHILIDIPTHTARFFPTPFLWPISSFKASGISWGNRWFMLANYSGLLVVYIVLWLYRRRIAAAGAGILFPEGVEKSHL